MAHKDTLIPGDGIGPEVEAFSGREAERSEAEGPLPKS